MAKRSTLILCLSLLLCLAMLFTSCDHTADPTPDDQGGTTAAEKPDATLEDQAIDYQGIITEWNQYLAYREPEAMQTLETQYLFSVNDADYTYSAQYGDLQYMEYYRDWESYGGEVKRTYNYVLYSTEEGVVHSRSTTYTLGASREYSYSYSFLQGVSYNYLGIVMETKTVYGDSGEESFYSFYDANKTALPTNLTERPTPRILILSSGDDAVVIGDNYYVCRDGEIIYTFKLGEERLLPQISFEYAGYKYYNDGAFLYVYNQDYELLTKYPIPEGVLYADAYNGESAMLEYLPNGNILLQWTVNVPGDTCDIEDENGNKLNLFQYVIDVKNGEVCELSVKGEGGSASYYFKELYGTRANDSTIEMRNANEMLVIAYPIEDGELASNAEFLIVDTDFNVKKVLPKFWINQGDQVRFEDADHLIVSAKVPNSHTYEDDTHYYVVNLSTKKVSLYVNASTGMYEHFLGGFIYENKIYNNDFEELKDLTDLSYSNIGLGIYYTEENEDGETDLYYAYIANGELRVKVLGDTIAKIEARGDGYILVSIDEDEDGTTDYFVLYDQYGKRMLDGDNLSILNGQIVKCVVQNDYGETEYKFYVLK